ncbi:MAG: tRNA adenosine deaminase-associated protein [Actinomycetota bacterium]|nr:tRNA adenosine deaminase-associated protein [Actinomycetota bacterium]
MLTNDTVTDFAVVAYRDEGRWEVAPLPPHATDDLASLILSLSHLPAETGALALVSVADDFFLVVRVRGTSVRLLVSDATAADEWPLARHAVDHLGVPLPDDDDDPQPAGDLAIVADLGMSDLELGVLCDDLDLYPDEVLGRVAARIGFGVQFEAAVDAVLR